jgi:hypothetical protein
VGGGQLRSLRSETESIACVIEDQAFVLSSDLAPHPRPLPYGSGLFFSVSPVELLGEGGGVEPNHATARKPGPL